MNNESKLVLESNRWANIIMNISQRNSISLEEATDIFYNSELFPLIAEGVADLQCRSVNYLATLIWDEHNDNISA